VRQTVHHSSKPLSPVNSKSFQNGSSLPLHNDSLHNIQRHSAKVQITVKGSEFN
jgi:hypothetical protein